MFQNGARRIKMKRGRPSLSWRNGTEEAMDARNLNANDFKNKKILETQWRRQHRNMLCNVSCVSCDGIY